MNRIFQPDEIFLNTVSTDSIVISVHRLFLYIYKYLEIVLFQQVFLVLLSVKWLMYIFPVIFIIK